MKELIKINNVWVEPSSWKKAVKHHPIKTKEVKEKGCKTYDEIVDAFEGDEPRPEVYELSRKWQDKVTLGQDLKELRTLLGWPLYQEWLRETITG